MALDSPTSSPHSPSDSDAYERSHRTPLQHHNPATQNLTRWFRDPGGWFALHPHDPSRLEVSLRVCLITLFAIALSVAHLPDLVPPAFRFLIGAAAPVIGMIVPMLLFTLAGVLPAVLFSLIVSLAGASMLLSAATVSDGLLTGIFTIYTLFFCGLFFGKDYDKTASNANLFIAFGGLISLSFKALIQADNGIDVSDLWTQQGLENPLAIIRNLMICFCWAFVCVVIVIVVVPPLRTARNMMSQGLVPAALMAVVSILDSHEKSSQDEGMATNEGKQQVTSGAQDGSTLYQEATPNDDDQHDQITGNGTPRSSLLIKDDALVAHQQTAMLHMWNATQGGATAKMILFEPRLFRAPFEASLVPALAQLLIETSKVCMLMYGLLENVHLEAKSRVLRDSPALKQWKKVLRSCAVALRNNTDDGLEDLVVKDASLKGGEAGTTRIDKPILASIPSGDQSKHDADAKEEPETTSGFVSHVTSLLSGQFLSPNKSHNDEDDKEDETEQQSIGYAKDEEDVVVVGVEPRKFVSLDEFILRHGQRMLHATIAWLKVINNPNASAKDGGTNLLKTMVLWIVAPILATIKRMVQLLLLPLHPSSFNLASVIWALELSAGFVGLYVMTVYWEGYSSFAIETGAHEVGGVFSGWQLSSYAFSFSPTAEGTLKKGILRLIGVASGGFAAWLGVIVVSGSYDNSPDINPYGLVAYLTVLSTIAAYIGHDGGLLAYMGAHHDYGAGPKYFVSNMCLIALEIYERKGSRDELTINRIVANCAGVAMAMVIAAIPPSAHGGSPKWALDYAESLKAALIDLVEKVLAKDTALTTDDYQKSFCGEAAERRKAAFFLLKDASSLHRLPVYRVSPAIKPILEGLTMQETLLRIVLPRAKDSDELNQIDGDTEAQGKLEELLKLLQQQNQQSKEDDGSSAYEKDDRLLQDFLSGEKVDTVLFNVETVHIVGHRILRFEKAIHQLMLK